MADNNQQSEQRHHNPRVDKLLKLQDSGAKLPLPATWIASLEAKGFEVDMQTGKWKEKPKNQP